MADETYNLEARISVDTSRAAPSLDKLADEFANLNNATDHSSKMIDRWEKRMVSAATNARTFTTNVGKGSGALKQQASAVAAVAAEYQKLARTEGTNIADMYLKGADEVQIAVQRIKNAERDRVEFAKAQTAEYRAAEAAKTRALQEAEKERYSYAQQANRQRVEMEEKARAQELASLKRVMQERAAAVGTDKISGTAYAENARRDLSGLVAQANQLGLARGLARDFFSEFRNSKDIDKQRQYLDMMEHSMEGLANQRYALYDVATTMTAISIATTGMVIAANAVEAGYDKAFGQVARTTQLTGSELNNMRDQLESLSHELPTAFGEITEIATIGAQMNIANESLEGFTQTVAQFSATTGVSVNETAMSLGRLAQLSGTSQSEISNLASSIYQTGINSVATEQQILEVASQIATAGNLAGFTNTEIVGLSSALASLGVAPEQSRGAIMRVFGDITEAVSTGGDALNAFASVSGMSAQEFKSQWGRNSQEVFSGYINGLSKLDKGLLDVTLKQQGFINVRDRNVLTRLANNTEVYAQALTDAGVAYQENTALAEGYNTATDNLIDNATRLKNILLDMAQSAGQSEFFNTLAKGAIALASSLENIVSSPVGQVLVGVVAGFTALVGIITAAVAVYATLTASLLAMTTGLRYVQQGAGTTTLGVRALTVELLRMTAGSNGAAAALFGLANAQTRAATTARIAGTAMRGVLLATGVGAALVAATYAFEGLSFAMKDATEQAKQYYDSVGIATDFSEAIKQDTLAYQENGRALRTVTQEATNNASAETTAKDAILEAAGARTAATGAADGETNAVKNNTIALGENVKAQAATMLASDERVQKLYAESDAFERLGGSVSGYLEAALSSPTGGEEYLRSLQGFRTEVTATNSELNRQAQTSSGLLAVNKDLQATINGATTQQTIFNDVMGDAKLQSEGAAIGMEELGAATEGTGNRIQDAMDSIYGSVDATYGIQEALFRLGESLYENGNAFGAFSEAGRANMDAVSQAVSAMATAAGNDTALFSQNVIGLMAQLQAQGINTGNELSWVGDLLNNLVGQQWGIDFNSSAARKDILAFIESAIQALRVRAQLERERIQAARQAQQDIATANIFSGQTTMPSVAAPVPDKTELNSLNQSIRAMEQFYSSAKNAATATNQVKAGSRAAGTSMQQGYQKGADAAAKAAEATKNAADKTKDMQKEVRTLGDYANDLSSIMERVTELMFGNQQAKDSVFDAVGNIRDDIHNAAEAVRDAREAVSGFRSDLTDARIRVKELAAELLSLKADRRILQYQLSVAIEYGDDLRASEIRGELAEKNAEITKTEKERKDASNDVANVLKELSRAQAAVDKAIQAASKSLTGNSRAARDNRDKVEELVAAYRKQITTAAANGATQKELATLTRRLSNDFEDQLRKMGFNRREVDKYKQAFVQFSTVIRKVPRSVTVTTRASTSAASQALREWMARKRSTRVDVKLGRTPSVGDIGAGRLRPSGVSVGGGGISTPSLNAGKMGTAKLSAQTMATRRVQRNPDNWYGYSGGGQVKYLASGGGSGHPGGPRGTDTIPAWLTPGEFVHKQKAVSHYGLPFMNAINNLQFPKYLATGSGSGSGVTPGVMLVELMPRQLQQLASMVSATVAIDGKVVAQATNNQNRNASVRRTN